MSFVLSVGGRSLDLGPTFDALRVFAELARLDPESEFALLHGLTQAESEEILGWHANALARQARVFVTLHRSHLSEHAAWFLEQLVVIIDEFELLLASAMEDTSRNLDGGLTALEKDVEERFVKDVQARMPEATVVRQAACRLLTWPLVGEVDVTVASGSTVAGLELKWWGSGPTGRFETLWDATKLASLVMEKQMASGYLLSGGMSKSWDRDDAFTRLFDDAEHITSELAIPAANFWFHPRHERTMVPALLITTSVARSETVIGGVAYELRLARVEPGPGTYAVPARQQRTRAAPG